MLHLPRFIKRFIRKHSRPKNPQFALEKRSKISLLYAFITWNLLGLVVYKIHKKRKEEAVAEDVSDGRYFADLLGMKNVKLMRFSGVTKVGEWDLEEEKKIHGKYLTETELKELGKQQQQLREDQGEQQKQREGWSTKEEFDAERL